MSVYDDCPRIASGAGAPDRPLRRFALIGDVHAEDERLEAAIAIAAREGVERCLCVGDVCDGHGDLDRTLWLLERHGVITVRGNHERWFLTDHLRTLRPVQFQDEHPQVRDAVRLWLPFLEVSTVRGPLLLSHAIGDDDMAVLKAHTSADELRRTAAWQRLREADRFVLLAAGHTHEAMVRVLDGITILNGGTLKRDDDPMVAIVDLVAGTMDLHDLDDPARPFHRETRAIP
ncbi:MAG: metallophosphatase family protein [Sandaracinaceae bacterium]|jgi:predicted phosphodiesterase|nr:metallophosphatase family protein [Sandaracinaceae bacterium]